jgi:hypothetical protein
MEVQEAFKFVESMKSNSAAAIVVVLYYLIVYWPRIKDGLGLSRNKRLDLERVEKNYQLLKLRIEIEQLKKNSGLDDELLKRLESEMVSRQEEAKHKSFTPPQKFIAIPLIILVVLQTLLELQAEEDSPTDILYGSVFVIITIIVGFWGLPILRRLKKSWLRRFGFIFYWSVGFYILSYFAAFIFTRIFLDIQGLPNAALGWLVLLSIIASLTLGMMRKLPFMRLESEQNFPIETDPSDLPPAAGGQPVRQRP